MLESGRILEDLEEPKEKDYSTDINDIVSLDIPTVMNSPDYSAQHENHSSFYADLNEHLDNVTSESQIQPAPTESKPQAGKQNFQVLHIILNI
jgi:hypothetical protein